MVKIESQGGITRVFLDRPEKSNALSSPFLIEILECFEKLQGDAELRVVVLAGHGKAFCGGADVTELAALDARDGGAFVERITRCAPRSARCRFRWSRSCTAR